MAVNGADPDAPFPSSQPGFSQWPGAVKGRPAFGRALDREDRCEIVSAQGKGATLEPTLPRGFQRGDTVRRAQPLLAAKGAAQ